MDEPRVAGSETGALIGAVTLLERAIGYALGALALITPEDLSRGTPCRDWDVRDLLLHVEDALAGLQEAVTVGCVGVPVAKLGPGTADPVGDLVGRLRERACRLLGSLVAAADLPGAGRARVVVGDRTLSLPVLAATGALEVAVHGWDVFRGCGVDRPLPGSLAAELLPLAEVMVTDADRPRLFAAPVPVAPGTGDGVRLLAFLGRDVAFGGRGVAESVA